MSNNYEVQVQNRSNKIWDTLESGAAGSRRKFLKKFDKNRVAKDHWRCVKT